MKEVIAALPSNDLELSVIFLVILYRLVLQPQR